MSLGRPSAAYPTTHANEPNIGTNESCDKIATVMPNVGASVGSADGISVGDIDGVPDGVAVGDPVGTTDGTAEGTDVGVADVGVSEGTEVGSTVVCVVTVAVDVVCVVEVVGGSTAKIFSTFASATRPE